MRITATKECVTWRGYIIAAGGHDGARMTTHEVMYVRNNPSGNTEWAPAGIWRWVNGPECMAAVPVDAGQRDEIMPEVTQ